MKNILCLTWLLMLLALGTVSAEAANHYIRAGGTASLTGTGACTEGSGGNWQTANACDDLPATLVRGDTYYVAGGSYASRTFDTPTSGTARIIIKKATVADHGGQETGWQASYGTTQAVWNAQLTWRTSNWTFDGGYRNENDWFNGTAYGFRVEHNSQNEMLKINSQSNPTSNIIIKYVYVNALIGGLGNTQLFCRCAINTDNGAAFINTGLVFSRMAVRGSNNVWLLRNTSGAILEYSASELADGNSAYHGDLINLYYSASGAIVRFNKFRDEYTISCGGCGSTGLLPACCGTKDIQVYGNEATNFRAGDGFVGYLDPGCTKGCVTGAVIYNNTIDNCNSATGGNGGINLSPSGGNIIQNNIWVNCGSISFQGGTHDYNAFPDSNNHGEAHAQTNFATSNFVNYAARDYRLASATTAGNPLPSPFNVDLLGNTRGANGGWDRGAYEFAVGGSDLIPPAAPIGISIQ